MNTTHSDNTSNKDVTSNSNIDIVEYKTPQISCGKPQKKEDQIDLQFDALSSNKNVTGSTFLLSNKNVTGSTEKHEKNNERSNIDVTSITSALQPTIDSIKVPQEELSNIDVTPAKILKRVFSFSSSNKNVCLMREPPYIVSTKGNIDVTSDENNPLNIGNIDVTNNNIYLYIKRINNYINIITEKKNLIVIYGFIKNKALSFTEIQNLTSSYYTMQATRFIQDLRNFEVIQPCHVDNEYVKQRMQYYQQYRERTPISWYELTPNFKTIFSDIYFIEYIKLLFDPEELKKVELPFIDLTKKIEEEKVNCPFCNCPISNHQPIEIIKGLKIHKTCFFNVEYKDKRIKLLR